VPVTTCKRRCGVNDLGPRAQGTAAESPIAVRGPPDRARAGSTGAALSVGLRCLVEDSLKPLGRLLLGILLQYELGFAGRQRVEHDGEALAVLVEPRCADLGPEAFGRAGSAFRLLHVGDEVGRFFGYRGGVSGG